MDARAPKGTQDILPPESGSWRKLQRTGTGLFALYGYCEIILPVMEYTEVFARGIGEDTDIVRKEMFTFSDKGGRSLTLRPEATAGVVRAFVQHHLEASGLPVKLYYQGPMFRHERPQAGRYREFQQLGVELIGSSQPTADAEVILLCQQFFTSLKLEPELVVNSVGDDKCRPGYVHALRGYLEENEGRLCEDCRRRARENPLRVLDCKRDNCHEVIEGAPRLEGFLCSECREHFQKVFELLSLAGLNPRREEHLVRGLDYYTRTVFEFQDDSLGAQNAIAAGGRYDHLIEDFGGKPTPAVGFSIGLERVMMAGPSLDGGEGEGVYLLAIGEEARARVFMIANELRSKGIRADLDHLRRSARAQMKEADRSGFPFCLILGEEEMSGGFFTFRDMRSGTQERVAAEELNEVLGKRFTGEGLGG
ncbi:MAG: histidine--tRNA ligase [Actinomycetota bacterium]|nr:histidine--tRNA ligase [Actinomycetota bacterium]